MKPISETYNMDCMEYMRQFPDKYFELALVDPPYGIGENWKKDRHSPKYTHSSTYKNILPEDSYFEELFRVSQNQIIWGGNYFNLPPTNNLIVWDKNRKVDKTFMSEGELAWTSFNVPFRFFRHEWDGARKGVETKTKTIHPQQKPIVLYKWCLFHYAKPGYKILDTHLGSGSSRIAAYDLGFDFYATEIDKEYFDAQEKRFRDFSAQTKLEL